MRQMQRPLLWVIAIMGLTIPVPASAQIGVLVRSNLESEADGPERYRQDALMKQYLEARFEALGVSLLTEPPLGGEWAWELTVDVGQLGGVYIVGIAVALVTRTDATHVSRGVPILSLKSGNDMADIARRWVEENLKILFHNN